MNSQPKTVQMFFDGFEVLRIKDGNKCHEILFPPGHQPDLMRMRWEREVVYQAFFSRHTVRLYLLRS